MTEHLRRDPSLNPDRSATSDPKLPVPERQVANDTDSRPWSRRLPAMYGARVLRAGAVRLPQPQRRAHRRRSERPCLQAMKRMICVRDSEVFASERQNLEQQWARNENVSTENLRVALRRYRSFFSRLLAI